MRSVAEARSWRGPAEGAGAGELCASAGALLIPAEPQLGGAESRWWPRVLLPWGAAWCAGAPEGPHAGGGG